MRFFLTANLILVKARLLICLVVTAKIRSLETRNHFNSLKKDEIFVLKFRDETNEVETFSLKIKIGYFQ